MVSQQVWNVKEPSLLKVKHRSEFEALSRVKIAQAKVISVARDWSRPIRLRVA
jgi:hypothetical protein